MNDQPTRPSWTNLVLGCVEALDESSATLAGHYAAEDRRDAAEEILLSLAGLLDDLNADAVEAYGEAHIHPEEVAGEHLAAYLAATAALQGNAPKETL